jgi:GAF domain-containing protein/DNA-binding CsgD family transcriptional regulator
MDDAIVDAIYAAVTQEEMLGVVLESLARRFGCRAATLAYVAPRDPRASIVAGYGIVARADIQALYHAEYADDDPAPAALARLRVGEIMATDRVFDESFKASSRFVQEFYHPLGLRESMGGPFTNGGGRFGVLVVQRGEERPPFTDDEMQLLAKFIPHVRRAVELRHVFFKEKARSAALEAALEESAAAVLAFDRRRALTHANAAARAILARADGLELDRAGRIRATDAVADARLQALLNHPHLAAPLEIIRVQRSGGGLPYVVRATPLQTASGLVLCLRVSEPDLPAGDIAAALRAALDLTEPSARLTAALLDGENIASYAQRAGVSQNTIKFHLKAAFQATACRRQADLVRIAGAVVRDLGLSIAPQNLVARQAAALPPSAS